MPVFSSRSLETPEDGSLHVGGRITDDPVDETDDVAELERALGSDVAEPLVERSNPTFEREHGVKQRADRLDGVEPALDFPARFETSEGADERV